MCPQAKQHHERRGRPLLQQAAEVETAMRSLSAPARAPGCGPPETSHTPGGDPRLGLHRRTSRCQASAESRSRIRASRRRSGLCDRGTPHTRAWSFVAWPPVANRPGHPYARMPCGWNLHSQSSICGEEADIKVGNQGGEWTAKTGLRSP